MSNLSTVLKARRKDLGLTLAQIADEMGVSEATVQRWESGNIKSIRHNKVVKLAQLLDVSPAQLMGWDIEPNKEESILDKTLRRLLVNATEEDKQALIFLLERLQDKK